MDRRPESIDSLMSLLIRSNLITETNAQLIHQFKSNWNLSTYDAVVETHLLTERQLSDVLADGLLLTRCYAISENDICPDAYDQIDFRTARAESIFPLGTNEVTRKLAIVVADPTQSGIVGQLLNRGDVELSIFEKSRIQEAILQFYPIEYQLPSLRKV